MSKSYRAGYEERSMIEKIKINVTTCSNTDKYIITLLLKQDLPTLKSTIFDFEFSNDTLDYLH